MHTSLRTIRVECFRQGAYIRSYAFNSIADAIRFTQESNLLAATGNKYLLVILS
jgi:hypothetical protein